MKYHLTLEITPYLCRSYTKEIVISEDPLEWISRDNKHHPIQGTARRLLQYRIIDEATYKKFREEFNPKEPAAAGDRYDPPSCRDFLMSSEDYSEGLHVT